MQINYAKKEVSCKLVYYGPGMSGKTTNLEVVHQKVPDHNKGEMTSIATEGDRTLFFDFLPLDLGKIRGMTTKFQLYTVPGQVYYASTRKLVLQGSDGVIFVADSNADKIEENIESLKDLENNLKEYGVKIDELPVVIQWNKRDLPNALPVEELEKAINWLNAATTEAVAATGEGVLPTLKLAASLILERLNSKEPGAPTSAKAKVAEPKEKKEVYVANINADKISRSYFNQYCQIQYRLATKSNDVEDFKKFSTEEKKKLLDSLINYVLLLQDSKARGIQADKDHVETQVKSFGRKFKSQEELDDYLGRRRLTLDNLRNEATRNVIIGMVIKNVLPNIDQRLKISSKEVAEYYESHKGAYGDKTYDQVKSSVVGRIKATRKKELLQEFFMKLREKSTIEIFDSNI